jgi:hypothetical protein
MTAWQPIETVPDEIKRDRTEILVAGPDEPRRVAMWDPKISAWRVNAHSFVVLSPTHWQPLPEPPEGSQ